MALTLPKNADFKPLRSDHIARGDHVRVLCRHYKSGTLLRVVVERDLADKVGIKTGLRARFDWLLHDDLIYVRILPDPQSPHSWEELKVGHPRDDSSFPFYISMAGLKDFPARSHTGGLEFGTFDKGLFFALSVGEKIIHFMPGSAKPDQRVMKPVAEKPLDQNPIKCASKPDHKLKAPQSLSIEKSAPISAATHKPARTKPDQNPIKSASKKAVGFQAGLAVDSENGEMKEGIAPVPRNGMDMPDWQIAHDDLILMMHKRGEKEWSVYEALGRTVTTTEIARRRRQLLMRTGGRRS